jgi:hypothetical protein
MRTEKSMFRTSKQGFVPGPGPGAAPVFNVVRSNAESVSGGMTRTGRNRLLARLPETNPCPFLK